MNAQPHATSTRTATSTRAPSTPPASFSMAPSVAKCGRTSAAADVDEHQGDELAAFNPHRDVDLMAVYRASLAAAAGVDEPGA